MALVTGAGSGLGEAIAKRLAADGAVVVVNDLDPAAAERVAKEVDGDAAPFDVTDVPAVDAAFTAAIERHGRLDILVNNAGIAHNRPEVTERSMANQLGQLEGKEWEPVRATSSLDDASWDRMIKVHLYGTFHCTRAALRHMEETRSGAIVNIASIAGIQSLPNAPDYSAAKGGIVLFTKAVGGEVAPLGIRVNAVAPGFIDTPLLSFMEPEQKQMLTMRMGARRLGRAEEVAEMVRFLAGDESSYCYGEILTLTGAFA